MQDLGKLSETEMEVMQTIWELAAPVTVTQLLEVFAKSKDWKKSTLSTILSRLIDKGFLTKAMHGNVNYYYSRITLEEYKKKETQTFLKYVHNGSIKSFMAALVGGTKLSIDEAAELKEWFNNEAGDTK